MEYYEEDELARALKEFIAIDKELETAKQILSLKTDFNLEDSFKLFDIENKGTINLRELEEGFNICNLFPRREEL
jgi:Ca2+-binding EF-hand superfamily protein